MPRRVPPMRSPIQRDQLRPKSSGFDMAQFITMAQDLLRAQEEIKQLVQTIRERDAGASKIERGPQGFSGPAGRNGRDATPVDEERLAAKVASRIPVSAIQETVAAMVLERIPFPKNGKDADPEKVIELLKKRKVKIDEVDGLAQTISAISNQASKGYLHGGGVPSLTAGSNITLVAKSDGGYIISSADSGNVETPVGAVDGTNTTFTVSNTPSYVLCDGGVYINGAGYTLAGLTITMAFKPQQFIRSIY